MFKESELKLCTSPNTFSNIIYAYICTWYKHHLTTCMIGNMENSNVNSNCNFLVSQKVHGTYLNSSIIDTINSITQKRLKQYNQTIKKKA